MTRVASAVMPIDELLARILGVCGKNGARVATVLSRGSLVSGDSRYRWEPVQTSLEEVSTLLDSFPDYDPEAVFAPANCIRIVFRDAQGEFEISREVASPDPVLAPEELLGRSDGSRRRG